MSCSCCATLVCLLLAGAGARRHSWVIEFVQVLYLQPWALLQLRLRNAVSAHCSLLQTLQSQVNSGRCSSFQFMRCSALQLLGFSCCSVAAQLQFS